MKKWILGICVFILLCIIAVNFIFSQKTAQKDITIGNDKFPNTSLSYIVKDFNGQVAVFEKSEKMPVRVLDVNVASLPLADQDSLKEGIKVDSEKELSKLLEDLCS